MEILSRILVTGWLRTTLIPTQAGWTLASLLFFGWPSGSSKAPDLRSLKSLRSVDRPEESIMFTDENDRMTVCTVGGWRFGSWFRARRRRPRPRA